MLLSGALASRITLAMRWGWLRLRDLNDLGRALLCISFDNANTLSCLNHLIRMIPGTTDAALSPDIASLNNPGPGLPNYTSPVFHQ